VFGRGSRTLVSPKKSGKCAKGRHRIVLASGAHGRSLQRQVNTLHGEVASLKTDNGTLTSELNALTGTVSAFGSTFSGVSRSGNLLTFSGMNVEVNSGAGSTSATPNGWELAHR
jgi:hypothetical protein